MKNEIIKTFKTIKQFPKYEINEAAQVRHKKTGRILKPYLASGYAIYSLAVEPNHYKTIAQHRLVMMTFNPIHGMDKLHVNHKNGNRLDNRVLNLEWCTRLENSKLPKFKKNKGVLTFPRGNKPFRAVITENRKVITVGYYLTWAEAFEAYQEAHLKVYGVLPLESTSVESLR